MQTHYSDFFRRKNAEADKRFLSQNEPQVSAQPGFHRSDGLRLKGARIKLT